MTGQAKYGLDTRVPGMLQAVVKRCPYLGGKVASFDPKKAMAVKGVRYVVPVTTGIATGVAVVADHTWAAMKGADALEVTWDPGPNRNFDSNQFLQQMEAALGEPGYFVRGDGDAPKALASAPRKLEAVYEFPFQAHAPLETMNCIADVRAGSCEIWAPTQTPDRRAQDDTAKQLGIPPESVTVNTTLTGGAFGRRLFVDYVPEAVEISKAIGKPVQVVWTRSDDMRFGFFQPPGIVRITRRLRRRRQTTRVGPVLRRLRSFHVRIPSAKKTSPTRATITTTAAPGARSTIPTTSPTSRPTSFVATRPCPPARGARSSIPRRSSRASRSSMRWRTPPDATLSTCVSNSCNPVTS